MENPSQLEPTELAPNAIGPYTAVVMMVHRRYRPAAFSSLCRRCRSVRENF